MVACGLVAHADGILEIGEWDQVLRLLDERVEGDEAQTWVDLLSDENNLRARLDGLTPPPPLFAESILEKAWRMALADGKGSEEEAEVHDDIGRRLGVDQGELQRLREAWTDKAAARAELVAGFAAFVAHLDGRMDLSEAEQFETLVENLPVPPERREELRAKLDAPPAMDEVVGSLAAMEPDDRVIALRALVPIVHAAARGDREREVFLELADAVAVDRGRAERMLEIS